jgi:hypothetical protein
MELVSLPKLQRRVGVFLEAVDGRWLPEARKMVDVVGWSDGRKAGKGGGGLGVADADERRMAKGVCQNHQVQGGEGGEGLP